MRAFKAILKRELLVYVRNKASLLSGIFMSIVLLFVFLWAQGDSLADIPGINQDAYMVSGIVIMSVFMSAFSSSLTIINDKSTGFMKEFLIAPINRNIIVITKIISTTILSMIPAVVLFIATAWMNLGFSIADYIEMTLICLLASYVSASIGMIIATKVKTSNGFMAIQSLITMPIMFLSGAYVPMQNFPGWLQNVGLANPMTYLVSLIRGVGSNSNASYEIRESLSMVIKIGNFELNGIIMYLISLSLATLLVIISLISFRTIDMSSKINWEEVA